MKRLIVLLAVLALLVTGATAVLADPIGVGGTFSSSSVLSLRPGNAYGIYKHLDRWINGENESAAFSPIGVGGT